MVQMQLIIIKQLFERDEQSSAYPPSPSYSEEKDWTGPCPLTAENAAQKEILTLEFSSPESLQTKRLILRLWTLWNS